MPASSDSCRDRSVRPSVSQQATLSWADLLNLTVVLAGAAVILWGDGMLMLPQQVFLWSLLVFFQVLRYGWALFRPFGAVMRYDLIRSARKGRYVSLRCLYATALLLMFFLVYWQWFVGPAGEMRRLWGAKVRANDWSRIVQLTDSVFHRFVTVQFVAILLLTPACTAGVIAEEKERRTLDSLLASDLANDEIILGKLLSRLAYLGMIFLTGLPFLSVLQLLGGIEPSQVLASFAAGGLAMLSLAALSTVNSIYCRRPQTVIFLTYLEVALYFGLSVLGSSWFDSAAGSGSLMEWLGAGNFFTVISNLFDPDQAASRSTNASGPLGALASLRDYAVFHGIVAIGCLAWAVAHVRRWHTRRSGSLVSRAPSASRLPSLGDEAMLWKELYVERISRVTPIVQASFTAIVSLGPLLVLLFYDQLTFLYDPADAASSVCLFACVLGLVGICALLLRHAWFRRAVNVVGLSLLVVAGLVLRFRGGIYAVQTELAVTMHGIVGMLSAAVAYLMLLGVAVRAAGGISRERERRTLDGLLASPLEASIILVSKWLGSILSIRGGWWLLTALWAVGLLTRGLHPLGLLAMLLAWMAYAVFLAGVGLYLSLVSRTGFRAMVGTLLVVAGMSAGPWLIGLCHQQLRPVTVAEPAAGPAAFPTSGFSPPETLRALACFNVELPKLLTQRESAALLPYERDSFTPDPAFESLTALVVPAGLLCYAVTGGLLGLLALLRFHRVTGRMPFGSYAPEFWQKVATAFGRRLDWLRKLAAAASPWTRFMRRTKPLPRVFDFVRLITIGVSICAVLLLVEWLVIGLVGGGPPEISFGKPINFLLRLLGTPLACLALVGVAVRAAFVLSGERGRRAFEILHTTPLESGSVLLAKWLGSLASVGRAWLWLGGLWTVGLLTGALHPLAALELFLACATYAAFLASLGVYLSLVHRTPVHTTAALLLICAALWIGSYPLGIGAQNLWATGRTQPGTAWLQLRAAGFSPPETLYALQVSRGDVAANPATDLFVVPVGLLCYALAAMWLGCLALFRFRRMVEDAHSENSQRDAEHLTQPQSQEGALTAVP